MRNLNEATAPVPRRNVGRRAAAALLLALAAATGLAACTPAPPAPSPGASIPGTVDPSGSLPPSTEPIPPSTPEDSTPVGITCTGLLTAEDLYSFNPNFSLIEGFAPAAGSPAAQAVAAQGIACGYVNQTSGDTIVIAVATPGAAELATLESALAVASTPTTAFGASGWFAAGTAQVISGSHWLTASADSFYEAADAAPLVLAALGHLG